MSLSKLLTRSASFTRTASTSMFNLSTFFLTSSSNFQRFRRISRQPCGADSFRLRLP
ncbi:hypothetical protein M3J09_013782 [Ascochyta lentis]